MKVGLTVLLFFRLATSVGVVNAAQLSKTDLFQRLNTDFNFERLMRAEIRRSCEAAPSLKRKRSEDKIINPIQTSDIHASAITKKVKLNNLDPIMMVPIGKKKTFKFSRPNGTIVQFNVDSLIDYLLASGDFHDPETRLPFSESDLREIDNIVCYLMLCVSIIFNIT